LLAEYDRVDTKLLASNLDVREKDVIDMQMRLNGPDYSLDAPVGSDDDGDGVTRGSLIANQQAAVDDVLANDEIRQLFGEQLDAFKLTLRGRDLEIFQDRIMNENPITLQEIGDRYGISRERARQIESRIISNLKIFVKDHGIIDLE
ncbi:MAG: RNA polymerase subunit sigma-70, partial [Proteobacteria bacterium]|nr:RNA polymerase subunit sigma-70 [Pseudomonadota bacterium]